MREPLLPLAELGIMDAELEHFPGIRSSGFKPLNYYNVYTITATTLRVPGFTDKENTLIFKNIIDDLRNSYSEIFTKGPNRIVAIGGFHSNHVHELYVGVPLQYNVDYDLQLVVETIGKRFEQSAELLSCTGTQIKSLIGFNACDEYMEKFKQTLNAYEPYEANVH